MIFGPRGFEWRIDTCIHPLIDQVSQAFCQVCYPLYLISFSQQPYEPGPIITPILQIKKLRPEKVRSLLKVTNLYVMEPGLKLRSSCLDNSTLVISLLGTILEPRWRGKSDCGGPRKKELEGKWDPRTELSIWILTRRGGQVRVWSEIKIRWAQVGN